MFRGNVRGYGLLHLKQISKFSYEFTEIQFYECSFRTSTVMVVLGNSKVVSVSQCPVSRVTGNLAPSTSLYRLSPHGLPGKFPRPFRATEPRM